MSSLSYFNEPAPLAWDVAAAIFGSTGEGGLYDPSSLDTLFQDANGTTPAVPGSPVGLVLDARQELGAEQIAGGDFEGGLIGSKTDGNGSVSSWAINTSSPISGSQDGRLVISSAAFPYPRIRFSSTPKTVGELRKISFDYKVNSGTAIIGSIYNGASTTTINRNLSGYGKFEAYYFAVGATSSSEILYFGNSVCDIQIDNFSIRTVLNPPLSQPTTAARPTLQPPGLRFDLADDALTTTLPQAINGDILIAGTKGSIIEPVSYAAGSTFALGPDTYTGGTPGIMRAIGDIVGVVLIDRTLTQNERDNLLRYYKGKGAKGLLVPGPELVVNGDFSEGDTGWILSSGWSVTDGKASITGSTGSANTISTVSNPDGGDVGKVFLLDIDAETNTIALALHASRTSIGAGWLSGTGRLKQIRVKNQSGTGSFGFYATVGGNAVINSISFRELRPQEDW